MKVSVSRNGVLLPRALWDYPRYWCQCGRIAIYNRLGRVYG